YKSTKRVRVGFTAYTKGERLKKQRNKCARCKKTLIKFNIDFDHKNGNRSDNRITNCKAFCTPCHRKKHSYD
ncbi:MAG: HNH endonuclease signature motif containing protein, partial [Nitrososphaeraceae archaeon]